MINEINEISLLKMDCRNSIIIDIINNIRNWKNIL